MVTARKEQTASETTAHKPTARVLDVLEVLSQHKAGCTLTDVAIKTSISKSTLSPILRTLKERRFVTFDDATGAYAIGINAFSTGSAYVENGSLLAALKAEMEEVVSHCRETCQLGVLDGANVFYLAKIDSPQAIRLISSAGRRIPVYCSALGKALLSERDEDEIRSTVKEPFVSYTAKTLHTVDELLSVVAEQKATGVFRETEESLEGVACLGVPLRRRGEIVAAVSVSLPKFRLDAEHESEIIECLHRYQDVAARILESYPDCDELLLG